MKLLSRQFDRVREPAYTGDNRCLPCTVVNVFLAMVLGGVVGIFSPMAGVLIVFVSCVLIAFRGYLVPGTPALTKRYLPDRVLRLFDKDTKQVTGEAIHTKPSATGTQTDRELLLQNHDVAKPTPTEEDLQLTPSFRNAWWEQIRHVRDTVDARDQLGTVLGVDPNLLTIDSGAKQFAVSYDGTQIGYWDSDAAFYADLAAEPTLREWVTTWEGLSDQDRTAIIAGMRAFLERCPSCEADLEPVENVRQSCCAAEMTTVTVECGNCSALVFTGTYR